MVARLFCTLCLVVLGSGCERWTVYSFTWLFEGSWTQIEWDESTFRSARVSSAQVVIPTGTTPPAELIEVFQAGSDLGLRGTLRRGASLVPIGVDASADIVEYDLSGLAPGEYTLVHRRSSESPGRTSNVPESRWSTFEGEPALINHLVVLPPPVADAGAPDAR